MASTFDVAVANDVESFLNEFGEDVGYDQLGDGLPKTIKAIVNRVPPEIVGEAFSQSDHPPFTRLRFDISIASDATLGIDVVTTNPAQPDTVTIKKSLADDDPLTFTVVSKDGPYGGLWKLGVVK